MVFHFKSLPHRNLHSDIHYHIEHVGLLTSKHVMCTYSLPLAFLDILLSWVRAISTLCGWLHNLRYNSLIFFFDLSGLKHTIFAPRHSCTNGTWGGYEMIEGWVPSRCEIDSVLFSRIESLSFTRAMGDNCQCTDTKFKQQSLGGCM